MTRRPVPQLVINFGHWGDAVDGQVIGYYQAGEDAFLSHEKNRPLF